MIFLLENACPEKGDTGPLLLGEPPWIKCSLSKQDGRYRDRKPNTQLK